MANYKISWQAMKLLTPQGVSSSGAWITVSIPDFLRYRQGLNQSSFSVFIPTYEALDQLLLLEKALGLPKVVVTQIGLCVSIGAYQEEEGEIEIGPEELDRLQNIEDTDYDSIVTEILTRNPPTLTPEEIEFGIALTRREKGNA